MKKIVNRGEIAIRVMRTGKKISIKTATIFSFADRNAPQIRFVNEAILIGKAPSKQSYLLGDKIIDIAKKLEIDAIQLDCGFLSKNLGFTEAYKKITAFLLAQNLRILKLWGVNWG